LHLHSSVFGLAFGFGLACLGFLDSAFMIDRQRGGAKIAICFMFHIYSHYSIATVVGVVAVVVVVATATPLQLQIAAAVHKRLINFKPV